MIELTLLTTEGCHLCDEAMLVLQGVIDPNQYEVYLEDIAQSEAMVEAYGLRIPVLRYDSSGAELNWPFSAEEVSHFIAPASNG